MQSKAFLLVCVALSQAAWAGCAQAALPFQSVATVAAVSPSNAGSCRRAPHVMRPLQPGAQVSLRRSHESIRELCISQAEPPMQRAEVSRPQQLLRPGSQVSPFWHLGTGDIPGFCCVAGERCGRRVSLLGVDGFGIVRRRHERRCSIESALS